jgi:hypothetical protein
MAIHEKNGVWWHDFRPGGSYEKRQRYRLPKHIITREQAEEYAYNLEATNRQRRKEFRATVKKDPELILDEATTYFQERKDYKAPGELHFVTDQYLSFARRLNLSDAEILNPTLDFLHAYVEERSQVVPTYRVNKELRYLERIYNYLASKSYCDPLPYSPSRLALRDKTNKQYFSEKFYELLIENFPDSFFEEKLEFVDEPLYRNKLYIPDSLFLDSNGDYVVVEIQKGRLDRTHAYKILEYRDLIEKRSKTKGIEKRVRMMVILVGDLAGIDRREFLNKYGIELLLISINKVEEVILKLLSIKDKDDTVELG